MYLGDLQEKDEDEMRKLWSEWKSKEKDGRRRQAMGFARRMRRAFPQCRKRTLMS